MSAAKIQAEARDLVARLPNQPTIVCVCIDAYGHRRLYPVTATADALAALVGAKTLEQWHLNSADANLALRYRVQTIDGLRAEIQAHEEWCRTMDAIDARANPVHLSARVANREARRAYCEAAERGEIPPPPPPAQIPDIGGDAMDGQAWKEDGR
jgi:hypothetical protein